jgi:FtsH-binding integral membrane protein
MAEPNSAEVPMNTQLLYRITGAALGIQLALGGAVTLLNLDLSVHIVWGVVLGIIALVTLVYVMRMPARPKPLMGLAIGIAVDILLQALLGFATAGANNNDLAFVHFLNAMVIFGLTLMATGMAMAGARMARAPPIAATT